MGNVFSVDTLPWQELRGLPGARGFEFKALTDDIYTKAYSCELVRLEPGDHSVPHVEPWSHLLYILSGSGDVTVNGDTTAVTTGTVCQVRAGEKHSLRNLGNDERQALLTRRASSAGWSLTEHELPQAEQHEREDDCESDIPDQHAAPS